MNLYRLQELQCMAGAIEMERPTRKLYILTFKQYQRPLVVQICFTFDKNALVVWKIYRGRNIH